MTENGIVKFIKFFTLLVDDEAAQKRRSGLYGLGSIAIALYNRGFKNHFDLMLNPVLFAFEDREPKVQLAACDAMFNILKICKEDILKDPKFPRTFDKILSVVSNPNNDVKDWGRKLIELLEDIIYYAISKNIEFDLEALLDKISKKLFKSKNQDIQLVLIKWIGSINSMTSVEIFEYLPIFLDKLFEILNTNPKHDVYEMSLSQLKTYLVDYEKCE